MLDDLVKAWYTVMRETSSRELMRLMMGDKRKEELLLFVKTPMATKLSDKFKPVDFATCSAWHAEGCMVSPSARRTSLPR